MKERAQCEIARARVIFLVIKMMFCFFLQAEMKTFPVKYSPRKRESFGTQRTLRTTKNTKIVTKLEYSNWQTSLWTLCLLCVLCDPKNCKIVTQIQIHLR